VLQVAKKLVRGDYKHNKVKDPTAKLDSKHEKTVKKFVKEFMDKAVQKKEAKDKDKAARAEKRARTKPEGMVLVAEDTPETPRKEEKGESDDDLLEISEDEDEDLDQDSPADSSATDLKRKREEDGELGSPKKSRTEGTPAPPPPPPPPPPPAEDMPLDVEESSLTPVDYADPFILAALNGSPSTELLPDRLKNGAESPMQLATPPTTMNGSCEHESSAKDGEQPPGHGSKAPIAVSGDR
jgi:[histone H3]-lysine36 N-trimethyltransferase